MRVEHGERRPRDAMIGRGVTRSRHEGHVELTLTARWEMYRKHPQQTAWVYFATMLLGRWLVASAFARGYGKTAPGNDLARVTVERHLWPVAVRATAMTGSDVVCGIFLVTLGLLSLNPRRLWAHWVACLVSIWLLFAPLVFWTPSAAAYANDFLVGIAMIALAVLIPGMPGMIMEMGPEFLPSWSYNPSAWLQRVPVITLSWIALLLAHYLAAYQLGYISSAWDAFYSRRRPDSLESPSGTNTGALRRSRSVQHVSYTWRLKW